LLAIPSEINRYLEKTTHPQRGAIARAGSLFHSSITGTFTGGEKMPNWCYTHLTIKGDSTELQTFFDGVKDAEHNGDPRGMGYRILNTYYPCPAELHDTVAGFYGDTEEQKELEKQEEKNLVKYGSRNWYDWCIENWGTKWGDCHTELNNSLEENDGTELVFTLESAWSPITKGLLKVSESFPNLYFIMEHKEEAGFYFVHECVHNGNLIAEMGFSDEDLTVEDEDNSEAWDEARDAMWEFNDIMFWDAMSKYGVTP
jgi:hypothetical protein